MDTITKQGFSKNHLKPTNGCVETASGGKKRIASWNVCLSNFAMMVILSIQMINLTFITEWLWECLPITFSESWELILAASWYEKASASMTRLLHFVELSSFHV